jgi:hypothetical protein
MYSGTCQAPRQLNIQKQQQQQQQQQVSAYPHEP